MRQINITENANKDRAWEKFNKLTKMALKNKIIYFNIILLRIIVNNKKNGYYN